VQFKLAFPLTFGEVFCTPLLTVICRSAGAVAVIVVDPGARHVASPVSSIVATTVFDDFHTNPSAKCNSRLVWSVNVPVAVKPTWPWGLFEAVADEGETVMLISLGWPAPQATNRAAISRSDPNRKYFIENLQQSWIVAIGPGLLLRRSAFGGELLNLGELRLASGVAAFNCQTTTFNELSRVPSRIKELLSAVEIEGRLKPLPFNEAAAEF
jgi:hypothetical protein